MPPYLMADSILDVTVWNHVVLNERQDIEM